RDVRCLRARLFRNQAKHWIGWRRHLTVLATTQASVESASFPLRNCSAEPCRKKRNHERAFVCARKPRLSCCHEQHTGLKCAVLVSANAEWKVVKSIFLNVRNESSPYGEYLVEQMTDERVVFFHGGFGKVAARASTAYVIDHFQPAHLLNIGTR